MLSLSKFKKSFGEKVILEIDDYTFQEGIHWVKGVNGSGKSTLFNCLTGISPCDGEIYLGQSSLRKNPQDYKLSVNYSPSEPRFPDFLSGNEMVDLFAKLKKAPQGQTEELVDLFQVSGFIGDNFGSFSSGMMKKISLLIAFLGKPQWIILDEPFITLDKNSQLALSQLIRQKREEGASFLFSTHQDFDNTLVSPTQIHLVNGRTINLYS